jgi:hypothetical protein
VLALLCSPTAVQPLGLAAVYETVSRTGSVRIQAEQQFTGFALSDSFASADRRPPVYVSPFRLETDTLLVFQLPPPAFPFRS